MFPSKKPDSSWHLSKYMDARLFILLQKSDTREEALQAMVDMLAEEKKLKDRDAFYQAIMEREKIVSTGIGLGVALPHAKLVGYESFFIAVGVDRKGIFWESLDGSAVRLIFMIGGPNDRQTEYLQLLSKLTSFIRDDEKRKKMLQLQTGEEMMSLFAGF